MFWGLTGVLLRGFKVGGYYEEVEGLKEEGYNIFLFHTTPFLTVFQAKIPN